jgi:hypothetical protein
MDELPALLSGAVGDAAVVDTVEVGGGDVVAVTHGATYVYRSDGLLKDESVESFEHDVERLTVTSKRKKDTIELRTLDRKESFTVPSGVTDEVVEAMIEGLLVTNDILDDNETVRALFRFSELTLVVTDRRLFEHVGSAVWDEDFEDLAYEGLSGLDFERGSVATQVVLETRERRRRLKVPNERAGAVRRQLQEAVFDFYGVAAVDALEGELDDAAGATEEQTAPEGSPSDPVDGPAEEPDDEEDSFVSADWSPADDGESLVEEIGGQAGESETTFEEAGPGEATSNGGGGADAEADVAELSRRVDDLAAQLDRQTELIESQHDLIEQLVEELRRGR